MGFGVGKAGMVGRPPYDPRDPRTMIAVNDYNRGYDDGCKARWNDSIGSNTQVRPKLLPKRKSL
jgi:hypothetical protein